MVQSIISVILVIFKLFKKKIEIVKFASRLPQYIGKNLSHEFIRLKITTWQLLFELDVFQDLWDKSGLKKKKK